MEETVKERTVTEEINTQFFRDSKNTVSVGTGNKFKRHGRRPLFGILYTTGRTESGMATERNKFKISTVRTAVHGTAVGRVTTMNHLVDILDDSRTRM